MADFARKFSVYELMRKVKRLLVVKVFFDRNSIIGGWFEGFVTNKFLSCSWHEKGWRSFTVCRLDPDHHHSSEACWLAWSAPADYKLLMANKIRQFHDEITKIWWKVLWLYESFKKAKLSPFTIRHNKKLKFPFFISSGPQLVAETISQWKRFQQCGKASQSPR